MCKGISHDIILGNIFLNKYQANIDYSALKLTLKHKGEKIQVSFGKFYNPTSPVDTLCHMNISSLYSGPQFIRARRRVNIPPNTIRWIRVSTYPCILQEDTVFIGNPALKKHYNLSVTDFILAPKKVHFIQVTNSSNRKKFVHPNMNLAVDSSNQHVFYGYSESIHAIRTSSNSEKKPEFRIDDNLTPEQTSQAKDLLESFRNVFVSDVSELRRCDYPPIRIDYDRNKVVRQRNYRMSPDEKDFTEAYIQKLLNADLVEYCTSVYCTLLLVVPKQSHDPKAKPSYRLVQDFRKVSKILKDLRYPVADQQELIDSFQGKFWHSVTDNCSGYTQLSIHPNCRDITAFDSPSGSRFRWKALPMGLSVAPALYALAMDHLLMEMKKEKKIVNYFDDTHLETATFEEHKVILKEYLQLLRQYRIKLNIQKSTFFQRKVQFLGVVIDGKQVTVSPKRVAAISQLSNPTDKDELRSRLGIFGYNRRFIQNYAQVSAPLTHLLRQDAPFKWEKSEQDAYDKLKAVMSNPPALRLYSPLLNNRVCTDASYQGLGVALYQHNQQDPETCRFQPIAFASRKLKSSEEKLPVYYLGCLGLVFAFVQFRCYLQNRNVEIEVLTDHQSLQALLKTPKPEGPIAKHTMYLAQFKNIKYRSGKSNMDADGLSRAPVDSPKKSVDELVDEVFPERIHLNTELLMP